MRKIKAIYWVIFGGGAVLTILCVIVVSPENKASLFLSGIAILISIIALGLSDTRKFYFNGQVKVWSSTPHTESDIKNTRYKISFKIINNDKEPVYDIVYIML